MKSTCLLILTLFLQSATMCIAQKDTGSKCIYPPDYCLRLPELGIHRWDKDYNFYNKFLTRGIMKTQMGLSYVNDGIHVWWCVPSAMTHVQLDTSTSIADVKKLVGEWEVVCSRGMKFIDSAVYADSTIHRSEIVETDGEVAGGRLTLTENKFRLYRKKSGSEDHFKKVVGRRYEVVNGRLLMLYKLSKGGAAISFIGMDKNGQLIINSHAVEERKKPGVYIAYQSVVQQIILRRKL